MHQQWTLLLLDNVGQCWTMLDNAGQAHYYEVRFPDTRGIGKPGFGPFTMSVIPLANKELIHLIVTAKDTHIGTTRQQLKGIFIIKMFWLI